jgi:hypothetical protein
VVLTATNVGAPLSSWTPLFTNTFDLTGAFHVTNAVTPTPAQHFFLIRMQ